MNTNFKVVEVLEVTDGFKDRYVLDSVPLDTKYASGKVTSISIVEVINSEAGGALIKIPVKKMTTNPDGIGYTYTFILYDEDGGIVDTKELTVDPSTGVAESSALFEISYSRLKNPDKVNTYLYTLKEDKKTKLGDIVVNNDKYTSYDETVFNIEVNVTNDSSGFNATYKVNGKNYLRIHPTLTNNVLYYYSCNDGAVNVSALNFKDYSISFAETIYDAVCY